MDQQSPFKWRHFEAEIILLCVRWYLRYSLSYRDLEEMMAERGLHLKTTNDSWRVDETYVKIKNPGCTSPEPWIQKEIPWSSC